MKCGIFTKPGSSNNLHVRLKWTTFAEMPRPPFWNEGHATGTDQRVRRHHSPL